MAARLLSNGLEAFGTSFSADSVGEIFTELVGAYAKGRDELALASRILGAGERGTTVERTAARGLASAMRWSVAREGAAVDRILVPEKWLNRSSKEAEDCTKPSVVDGTLNAKRSPKEDWFAPSLSFSRSLGASPDFTGAQRAPKPSRMKVVDPASRVLNAE